MTRSILFLSAALLSLFPGLALARDVPGDEEIRPAIRAAAMAIAAELAKSCPMGDPSDSAALASCSRRLRSDELLASLMADFVDWGGITPGRLLAEQNLTRFGSPAFRQLYLSLFMFSGVAEVDWNEIDSAPRILLAVKFRDGLKPGMFPYPFWHLPAKWSAYQATDRLALQFDQNQTRIVAAMRVLRPIDASQLKPAPMPFDGKWTWIDDDGKMQPAVTLFDGIYRPGNPNIAALDRLYRDMALELRDQDCLSCHIPSNPNGMKRLVLLQSPAHAASEIERVVEAVRAGKMPQEEWASPKPFPSDEAKQRFLGKAEAFADAVRAADAWEKTNPRQSP